MLGTVPVGEYGPEYLVLGTHPRLGSATSSEAEAIREALKKRDEHAEQSQALFGAKTAALSELRELAVECSEPGWDGHDSQALDPGALTNAQAFIRALPGSLPLPEPVPEPDGAVSLDWIESPHRMVSISVNASGRLAYAWLDGTNRGHAVVRFNGATIPAEIIERVRGVIGNGSAGVGTS